MRLPPQDASRGKGAEFVPHGAPEIIAYGILGLFSLGLILHWTRRIFTPAFVNEPPRAEATKDLTVFDRVQRLFHWATLAVLAMIIITGFALYDPSTFAPIADALGIPLHSAFPSYVLAHVIFSASFAVLLGIHVAWDVKRLRALRRMWPSLQDFRDGLLRGRNFFSMSRNYPRMSKYDAFMKSFHLYLIVSSAVLAFTGIYQYFYASWWNVLWFLHSQIEPWWRPTVIHDVFGFGLIALVVGHLYFGLLRVNRPLLRAMINGKISKSEVNRRYRSDELQGT
ncbi:MAG: cytochrome b/b6 domain-containing protein [Thaumarchaeota archaeon]|nr:MAG: cytochrome b/b6 domain-containing protein [Nitrososphaerota archaeon]